MIRLTFLSGPRLKFLHSDATRSLDKFASIHSLEKCLRKRRLAPLNRGKLSRYGFDIHAKMEEGQLIKVSSRKPLMKSNLFRIGTPQRQEKQSASQGEAMGSGELAGLADTKF